MAQLIPDTSIPRVDVLEADAKLDDVMLAMDVVDTLRHERMLITRDINSEVRRETLVDRLREIYRGQGITVPDDILMDGVEALEEERFRYAPPRESFGTKLARAYINRGKWLPLLSGILVALGLGAAVNYAAFDRPARIEQERIERTIESLPAQLQSDYDAALALAGSRDATTRIEDVFQAGEAALQAGDSAAALSAAETLQQLRTTIPLEYNLEIVERRSARYGFAEDGISYIVVDAVAPDGRPVSIPVTSTATGQTASVSTFALEVDRVTAQSIIADVEADGRLDARDIGTKASGEVEPDYTLDIGSRRLTDAALWRTR